MIRKLLPAIVAFALLALAPAALAPPANAAPLPQGFIGISPQGSLEVEDFETMRRAGIRDMRLPLFWFTVESERGRLDWTGFEKSVAGAAAEGIRVLPFVWGTPGWVAAKPEVEPVGSRLARRSWMRFLRVAAARYGPRGRFWRQHPELPYRPMRRWEIWNEANIVSFSRNPHPGRFGKLMTISAQAIRREDRGARILVGGLFGRPLQIPPNIDSADFVDRMYRVPGVRRAVDGIGLHPYVRFAREIWPQATALRDVMRRNRDARARLYFTEVGWGSDGFESRWERGVYGQARELHRSFALIAKMRRRWNVGSVEWFSWMDAVTHCQFCDSSGLLTGEGEAKPSWYRFIHWTGGERDLVPRAPLPLIPIERVSEPTAGAGGPGSSG